MSDQVVFTKEEVEKIDHALRVALQTIEPIYTAYPLVMEACQLLDFPRPRPKVDIELLRDIQAGKWEDKEIVEYFSKYGIDVGDYDFRIWR